MATLLMEITGFLASAIAFAMFVPQAVRTWRTRNDVEALRAVSITGQWLLLANAALWAIYAVGVQALWVGAPSLVNGPLAICTLVLLYRAQRVREHRVEEPAEICEYCVAKIPHRVFITTPPGFGAVMACSPQTFKNGVLVFTDEDIRARRAERMGVR